MEIRCIIKDAHSEWEETLKVDSMKTAEIDTKEILKQFNNSLRCGETIRSLVKIIKEKKTEEKTFGDVLKDISLLSRDLRHEVCNLYGNTWLKNGKFARYQRNYERMFETGKATGFRKILREIFDNVRDIQNYDDLKYLYDYDFESKLKEAKTKD